MHDFMNSYMVCYLNNFNVLFFQKSMSIICIVGLNSTHLYTLSNDIVDQFTFWINLAYYQILNKQWELRNPPS